MQEERPGKATLEECLFRAFKFLGALGKDRDLMAIMFQRGYTNADQDEGWELLHKAAGYTKGPSPLLGATISRAAQAELDQWDEPNFQIAQAALTRKHPAQARFIFDGLKPGRGAEAVVTVKLFLDRLDALDGDPTREATREEDRAALDTLAKRGIGTEERLRLRDLIAQAQQAADFPAGTSPSDFLTKDQEEAQRQEDLYNLYLWHRDWATTASRLIRRRDYLIRLGLAQPQRGEGEQP